MAGDSGLTTENTMDVGRILGTSGNLIASRNTSTGLKRERKMDSFHASMHDATRSAPAVSNTNREQHLLAIGTFL